MRRASYTPLPTQAPSEPLIVVEESGNTDDESGGGGDGGGGEDSRPASPPGCDSPLLNPCLLSPYRDMRKRSLPTPACTSGITASQVRRLSEHGVGTEGAAAREAAFLATLQQAPTPAPGGRRHSVVTISRAPPSSILFGRGRRESIAAFPSGGAPRVLPPRRDSVSAVPPRPPATSGATSGSTHNLQLDIMDDIAEIKAARKVRLKMWRTPSRERVCEVQPLDGGAGPSSAAGTPGGSGQPTRYQSRGADAAINRRYSDFVTAAGLAPAAGPSQRRRASEQPPSAAAGPSSQGQGRGRGAGIVCTNSDLISILSSLASSAQEINRDPDEEAEEEAAAAGAAAAAARAQTESPQKKKAPPVSPSAPGGGAGAGGNGGGGGAAGASGAPASADQKRSRLKSLRSNSFDVSMLLGTGAAKEKQAATAAAPAHSRSGSVGPASWFIKRHQPKRAAEAVGAAAGGAGAAAGGTAGGGAASKAPVVVTFRDEKANASTAVPAEAEGAAGAGAGASAGAAGGGGGGGAGGGLPVDNKVVWDGRSGSVVDAQVLGSAIEDFLARRGSGNDSSGPPSPALQQGAAGAPATSAAAGSAAAAAPAGAKASPAKAAAAAAAGAGAAGKAAGGSWFSAVAGKEDEEAAGSDTCDSSICSTLKDLFVK